MKNLFAAAREHNKDRDAGHAANFQVLDKKSKTNTVGTPKPGAFTL